MTTPRGTVRVQRSGPRGWHYIAKDRFDPAVHVECDEDGNPVGQQSPAPARPEGTTIHLSKEPAGPDVAREIGSAFTNLKSSNTGALEARDVGRGWFKIHRGDVVVETTGAMRKDDADAFNALSDKEKEAHIKPAEDGE